jgi:hypothetical protein
MTSGTIEWLSDEQAMKTATETAVLAPLGFYNVAEQGSRLILSFR